MSFEQLSVATVFEVAQRGCTSMRHAIPCLALLLSSVLAAPAAGQTAAATVIVNIAGAQIANEQGPATIASNPAAIRIDELLDIALATEAASAGTSPTGPVATAFTLTNRGNGSEAFVLAGVITGTGTSINAFAIDSDGNGVYDAGTDTPIANQGTTPALAAGASLSLFVLVGGESGDFSDLLTITARALTGSGVPGAAFNGAGDQGCDAIVGLTTAAATLTLPLRSQGPGRVADPSLIKSQSVQVLGGGSQAVAGSIITYTIDASFTGPALAARISDPLPLGTDYVPGSLHLDGVALSDAADGDAGSFDGAEIRVALGDVLGDVLAPANRRLQFQVIIK